MSRPCYSDATTALQSVDRRPGPACWTCGTTLALEIVGSWGVAAPPSSLGYQERGTDCGSPVTPRGAATLLNPLSLKYFQQVLPTLADPRRLQSGRRRAPVAP